MRAEKKGLLCLYVTPVNTTVGQLCQSGLTRNEGCLWSNYQVVSEALKEEKGRREFTLTA